MESEFRRLHRRFGHPHSTKLYDLLHKTKLPDGTTSTLQTLQAIESHCQQCQSFGPSPRRFKFNIRDDIEFNHSIYLYIFYLKSRYEQSSIPVLHFVDEATRFQAQFRLSDLRAGSIWSSLRGSWIDAYLGPPDVFVHDSGSNGLARFFQADADILSISCKAVSIEAANAMTNVERFHQPVRQAFGIIEAECPSLSFDDCLQTALKSVNDSVDPEGLVPTLLVFGGYPRLGFATDATHPSNAVLAIALQKPREALTRSFSRRQVRDALGT